MTNRAELVRRLIAYRAATREIETALKNEGELEHRENGTTPTWRMAYALVSGSESSDKIEVTDPDAFLGYMARRNPTEVQVVSTFAVRNPDWMSAVKQALANISREEYDSAAEAERQKAEAEGRPVVKPQHGRAIDVDGTVIPGAVFRPGGAYVTTSVTPKMQARRKAIRAAKRGVLTGDWSELERAITDPGYLSRAEADEEEAAVATHEGRRVESLEGL